MSIIISELTTTRFHCSITLLLKKIRHQALLKWNEMKVGCSAIYSSPSCKPIKSWGANKRGMTSSNHHLRCCTPYMGAYLSRVAQYLIKASTGVQDPLGGWGRDNCILTSQNFTIVVLGDHAVYVWALHYCTADHAVNASVRYQRTATSLS